MPNTNALIDQAINSLIDQAIIAMVDGAVKALAESVSVVLEPFDRIDELKDLIDSGKQAMYERLGANAQTSMLASYAQLVTAREKAASATHYRAGEGRLAGGILRAALSRSDFYSASGEGLEFANSSILDGAARQWRRIAFGAGGRGRGSAPAAPVDLGDISGAIGINETPSPGFSMPAGVWVSAGGARVTGPGIRGEDMFYPQRVKVKTSTGEITFKKGRAPLKGQGVSGRPTGLRPTRGIAGADFISAGTRRIAADLPVAVKDLFEKAIEQWLGGESGERQVLVREVMAKVL